jgi:peptide deformylase
MAIRPILDYTQPVLRRKAQRVEAVSGDLRRLVKDMRETMKAAPGVGLAAPQVGESLRVIVYETEEAKGCLSIPGLQGEVTRALHVRVAGQDERGRPVRLDAEGYLARVLQHEIDHLDGVLFIDRARPETLHRIPARPAGGGSAAPNAPARSGAR